MSKTCPYCGNNPVPHLIYWYNETLNILLTPLRQKILYNSFSNFLKRKERAQKLAEFFLGLGEALKIITRQSHSSKCNVRRAEVLWKEGEKRGVKMEELLVFGKPFDTYVASRQKTVNSKQRRIIFSGLPRPAGYLNPWLDLMDDKWLFKKKLLENNLPVPAGGTATKYFRALKIFKHIQKPLIIKPRGGSRGRHTTTFVTLETDLKRAFYIAKQLCYWVMVEEQLQGPVYRATLVNFELAGLLRGDPPQVVGDGVSSIEQLINKKNQTPVEGVKNIRVDNNMKLFLLRQGLGLSALPKKEQLVNLSEKIGVNYGGSSSEDYDICHSDNKALFIKAAKVLGDPLVGFDFIIPDISESYKKQKCGFIEVNSLPFINLHHDPLHKKPSNVAAKVWDMVGF